MSEQLAVLFKPLAKIFSKHHSFIFIIVTCLLLALAIYLLYGVLTESTTASSNTSRTIGNFDKKTVEQIKNLHDSSDTGSVIVFPSPRPDPFVE